MKSGPTIGNLTTITLDARDRARLAEFCVRCATFFELVEGTPGGPETAAEILGPLPAPVAQGTKHVFGFERGGDLIERKKS